MRARVVRREFFESEWPATMRNPVALLEVPWIQRTAPAAPAVAAAAEIAAARAVRESIRQSGVFAAVQVARFFVRRKPAAFQQAGIHPGGRHFACERDARDASPNNADRRFDDRILFDIASTDDHPQLPCSSS